MDAPHTGAIVIAGSRDTHEHYPHPPTAGTLRAIGAAMYKAALEVCQQPNLTVSTSPIGVFKVGVEVCYDDLDLWLLGILPASRRAKRAAIRRRESVRAACTQAAHRLALPGMRIEVTVTVKKASA